MREIFLKADTETQFPEGLPDFIRLHPTKPTGRTIKDEEGRDVPEKMVLPGVWASIVDRGDSDLSSIADLMTPWEEGLPRRVGLLPTEESWNAEINEERDKRLSWGVTVGVTGIGDIPVQGRDKDMSVILGLRVAAAEAKAMGVTAPVMVYRDRDNTEHSLTPAQCHEMCLKAQLGAQALYQASWALKSLEPGSVDVTDGSYWP